VKFYEDERKRSECEDFLMELPFKVRAKIFKWITKLEEAGPNLPRPYADVVKGKIRELRIQFSPNQYRFLYFFFGKTIVITNGFIKKTGSIPQSELNKAENYMNDFLSQNDR